MNIPSKKFYADSLAFLGLQGQPPVNRSQLSLAHITSVPPYVKDFDIVLRMHLVFQVRALSNAWVHGVYEKSDISKPDMGILFGLQHAPEDLTLARVRELASAGIRSMAIAYDGSTEYGDGFKGDGGLTPQGEKLIDWMCATGIILDLSHAGHATAREAIEYILRHRLPMMPMMSHSGCYELFPH